ncbi:MAG TPA: endonuclease III [Gemmatimonadales bacterium]|nr:endonuclease III [Gemmatimonadales bacterium]
MLARIREAVRPLPKAAMFALAEQGHRTLFEQLVACILSIRTRDEVSLVAAQRLFATAPSPRALAALDPSRIDTLIGDTTFHGAKARQIREIARFADRRGGELPCDEPALLSLPGVGPKCAHLALGIACGATLISVDIHVHRVTNRWGYVGAPTPERTMAELEQRLPLRYWVEINSLLVPFGKHVCTGRLPKCSTCPVLDMCRQVGVEAHR